MRDGYEVLWPVTVGDAHRLRGTTTGLEDGAGWSVSYDVDLDEAWRTRTAVVRAEGRDGRGEVLLEREGATGAHRWSVDGRHWPELDGIVDVDLEASAATNTLPLHRVDLEPGVTVVTDAVFVRLDLRVHRLRQTYQLVSRETERVLVAYTAPAFDVACTLVYDAAGLVLDYPDLAVRQG